MSKKKYNYDFERIDLRRTWLVLGAIDDLERPTVSSIAKAIDFKKPTVQKVIANLESNQFPDLHIEKDDAVFTIKSWGVVNAGTTRDFYLGYFK